MKKKIPLFLLGVGVFLFFVFFSYFVHKDLFTNFDFDTTVKLQDNIPRKADDFFSFLSLVGAFEIATLVLIIILVIRRKLMGILVLFSYGFFHLLELYGKVFVDHLPPPEFMVRTKKLTELPQFYVRAEFSYPSGHAARAAFLSIVIAFLLLRTKKLKAYHKVIILALLFAYDFVMFVSRAYLGEHWLSDVLGGALLGASFALMSLVFI